MDRRLFVFASPFHARRVPEFSQIENGADRSKAPGTVGRGMFEPLKNNHQPEGNSTQGFKACLTRSDKEGISIAGLTTRPASILIFEETLPPSSRTLPFCFFGFKDRCEDRSLLEDPFEDGVTYSKIIVNRIYSYFSIFGVARGKNPNLRF